MQQRVAQDGAATPPPPSAPTEVAFLGSGNVLPAYLQIADRLVARGLVALGPILVRSPARRVELQARRPSDRYVATIEEVLASSADIVVVITPPECHSEHVAAALEVGKHVLVEKPVAPDRAQAEALYAMAARSNRHLVSAPFVHLSHTVRELWTRVQSGEIGHVHLARALYGNPGSNWSRWYHEPSGGPLHDLAIYNLKTLTALLGPVQSVVAVHTASGVERMFDGTKVPPADSDGWQLVLRHETGALSSVAASHAIQRYRRPAIELYGTTGTANLLGDDWDPSGFEIWTNATASWTRRDARDRTWLWTDGLRDLVESVRAGSPPTAHDDHDLHLLDVIDAARRSAESATTVAVDSSFRPLDLTILPDAGAHAVHDRTRSASDQ